MHRFSSGMLAKLNCCQWTVGSPDFGTGVFHAAECFFSNPDRGFEGLGFHRIRSIMPTAFHGQLRFETWNQFQQISAPKPGSLRTQMAWGMVRDLFPRCAFEISFETFLF
ncbi:uncharacterized protein METZ01_LOCUS474922, partial [marine metagenome]